MTELKREIKFRAWVDGSPVQSFICPTADFSLSITDTGLNLLVWSSDGIIDEIDVLSVDQFTGLKDKNGVEIYEGDIIRWGENTETVYFNDGMFQTETSCLDDCMKVIGNIYENPELLGDE